MSLGIIGILKCQNGLSDQYVEAKKRCDASVELWGSGSFTVPGTKGCVPSGGKKTTPSMLRKDGGEKITLEVMFFIL